MNQNYNSLLSPKKHTSTKSIQFNPVKEVPKNVPTNQRWVAQQQKVVSLSRDNVIKEIQLFGWRCKTSLPILKVTHYSIYPLVHPFPSNPIFETHPSNIHSPNKSKDDAQITEKISCYVRNHSEVQFYELRIKTEEVRLTLQEIDMLPIPQIIYLLKEVLIGFEVLIDIFGLFTPRKKMIVLNHRHQWRVWINEQYALSTKSTQPISEKEFILTIVQFAEQHSLPNKQSKNLFELLRCNQIQQQYTFLNILQKINQFVSNNKIFHVTKVILNNERITPHPEGLKSVKFDLQRIVTPPPLEKKVMFKPTTLVSNNNRSMANLMDRGQPTPFMQSPISKPQNNFKPNNTMNYNVFSPTSPTYMKDGKCPQFNKFCDNWQKNNNTNTMNTSKLMSSKNIASSIDYSQVIYPPTTVNFQQRPNFNTAKHSKNPSAMSPISEMKKTTFATSSPTKNRKEIKEIVNERPKPVSRLEQSPQRRNTRRKYSQDIILVKSVQRLTSKQKCGNISSIYNPNQIKSFNKIHEPIMVSTPTAKTIAKVSSQSPQVKGMSSPNNSSSTKQIQQSGELKSNYTKLKMKDLGGDKPTKNNQSVINSYHITNIGKKDKNMAVSYQFESKDCDKSSDSEHSQQRPNKGEAKWDNKISGLFSDNLSIKHLKESIKIRSKEEEHFEKEYLKDIKLDLLEKFGRKANHIVEEDDFKFNSAHYKSMQLIEEELEQGKSYFDQQQKMQDFPRQTKSRQLTMQVKSQHSNDQLQFKQCNSEQFDDNDLDSQINSSENDGFNFQTEMYTINPSHP